MMGGGSMNNGGRMRVERQADGVRIELSKDEVRLLRLALERASFIDTPVSAQGEIAAFCSKALEALAR
jgi:hypothetical protein